MLITSDDKFAIIPDSLEGALGTVSGLTLTGTIYSLLSVSDLTATVTDITGDTATGTYTSTAFGNGTFTFTADSALYDRGADLAKLEGIWNNDTNTIMWTIMADGTFTVTYTLQACTGSGQFSTIDPAGNEYSFSITTLNCSIDDTFNGLAFLSDGTFTDDVLSLVFGNASVGVTLSQTKQ
jgi:hypothetical protein